MSRLVIGVTRSQICARGDAVHIDVPADDLVSAIDVLHREIPWERMSQVVVGADQLGVAALDARGLPVAEILWADDQRSAADAAWCSTKFSESWWIERVGASPQTHHGVTKLSWLHRSESDAWSRIAHICGVDDHVRWLLGGSSHSAAGVLDDLVTTEPNVRAFAIAHPRTLVIDPDVLALIDRDRDWNGVFAPIAAVGTVVGAWNGTDIVI